MQALVDGRFRALDYLIKNPQDAASRIAPRTGVTPEQFLESLKGLSSPNLEENQNLLGKTDPSLLNTVHLRCHCETKQTREFIFHRFSLSSSLK